MVTLRIIAVVLVAGCRAYNPAFCPAGVDETGECKGGGGGDGGDGDAAGPCFGTQAFAFCVMKTPAASLTVTHLDTSAGCDEVIMLGREVCVVMATNVTISQRVTVGPGSRPLVLLASDTLTVDVNGILDASASGTVGGTAADIACDATGTKGASNGGGGSGGAGGSFGTAGKAGGTGGGTAPPGAAAAPISHPSALQGGCSGTDGGDGGPSTHGSHGAGGGAVYLVAGQKLAIAGTVLASGSGGQHGTPPSGGGGGGGSGGMIVLYAPTVVVQGSGRIFANGGGGASGANLTSAGSDGATSSQPLSPAIGGAGAGGAGGDGAFGTTSAKPGTSSAVGAGGGGGGAGVIYVLGGDVSAAQVSPAPT